MTGTLYDPVTFFRVRRIITPIPKRIKNVSSKSFANWSVFPMVKRIKTWTEASFVLKILVDWLQFQNTRPLQLHSAAMCLRKAENSQTAWAAPVFRKRIDCGVIWKECPADNIAQAIKKKINTFKAGKHKTVLSTSQIAYFSLLVERMTQWRWYHSTAHRF